MLPQDFGRALLEHGADGLLSGPIEQGRSTMALKLAALDKQMVIVSKVLRL